LQERYFSNPLRDDEQLYFLHIPKTAGITFYNIVRFYFPEGTFAPHFFEAFMQMPLEERRALRLIGGHYGYNVEGIFGRQPTYITMLRDPYEQVISHYYYARAEPNHLLYEHAHRHDIVNFYHDPYVLSQWANLQVCYLAQDIDHHAYYQRLMQRIPFGTATLERATSVLQSRLDPALLPLAIERLDAMRFVGIVERFDDSLRLLFYTLGWPVIASYPTYNTTPDRPRRNEMPDGLIDVVKTYYALDVALYEHAAALFARRYDGMVNALIDETRVQRMEIAALRAELERQRAQPSTPITPAAQHDVQPALGVDESPLP
jgi:hypothetical protein